MNNNYKDKLKKIKYRCQTLGIKELDVIFKRIYSKLENTNDEALMSLSKKIELSTLKL